MRASNVLPPLGWGAVALALAVLSVVTMAGELRPPLRLDQAGVLAAEPAFGLSRRSAAALLEDCETELGRLATRLLPEAQWRAALTYCRDQAQLVTQSWPTDARAWLLAATASYELGEPVPADDALARSQKFADAVHWLAQRRLALADERAPVTGRYSYAADVLTLLQSDAGTRGLAASWVAGDAARRARIEAAATQASAALQQRLLDRIRDLTLAARSS